MDYAVYLYTSNFESLWCTEDLLFILFQVFAISIINGCDKIEQKYLFLLSECSELHIKIKEDSRRDDLQSVENYVRNLPPVFTAAGFFQLNQRLLSSFCSTSVTYIIIFIQFAIVGIGELKASSGLLNLNLTETNFSKLENI